jgi:chemotaxis regulatin CheY-phosphate phosphatase CheZ
MKELFEQFFKIIDQANGVREKMEADLKKYVDENQKKFQDAAGQIKTRWEEVMKKVTDPQNFQEIMQKIMDLMKEFIGEDMVAKLLDVQKKFPFINDYMKTIFPK